MIRIVTALLSSLVRRLCRVARRGFAMRMHRGNERNDRIDLRGTQVLAICRHISATLDNLPHDLAPGKACRSVVKCRSAQTACTSERMTIAALFALNQDRTLQLEWRATFYVIDRSQGPSPCVHRR